MIKKGLGKGIGALLPVVEDERKHYFLCPIEDIRPHAGQPRKTFTPEKLEELAASIREKGIIQPLVVRKCDGYFELIAGERRWRAAQKAGLHEVPVVIQDVSDGVAMEMALIENIQREDLNAVEEADAYRALMDQFALSQEEVAKRVGKERSTVANSLRLLRLPDDIQRDIIEERLSMGHARALLALDDSTRLRVARDQVLKERLTVRATEALVKRLKDGSGQKKKADGVVDIHLADLETQLRRRFQAKVFLRSGSKGGAIEIPFASQDELARLIDQLLA